MKKLKPVAESARVVPRAVTIEILNPTRRELDPLMAPAFDLSTRLANWAVHTLFRRDTPGERNCPAQVKERTKTNPAGCYLYDLAKRGFDGWELLTEEVAQSAASILRRTHGEYLDDRKDFMCDYDSSLLTKRYPQPFPIHNARWHLEFRPHSNKIGVAIHRSDQANNVEPIFTCNLPSLAGVEFRLRTGPQLRRQVAMLRQIENGDALVERDAIGREEPKDAGERAEWAKLLRDCNAALRGEAAILRKGRGKDATYYLKIVGRFPVRHRSEQECEHACLLTTQPHALLCAEINGRSTTITNCDALKRAMAVVRSENERHRRFLQRSSEDMKFRVRRNRRQERTYRRNVAARCEHARQSINTTIGHIAAQTAEFLNRQRVGCVVYDDSKRQFLEDIQVGDQALSFPWFALASQLKNKLLELGVLCVFPLTDSTKTEQKQEYEAWLANPKAMWASSLSLKRLSAHKDRPKGRSNPAVCVPSAT